MCVDPVHIVAVDRRAQFRSPTMPVDAVKRIESAFRAGSWFGDRWSRRRFREAAMQTLHTDAGGGLVLMGPGLGFEPPPPFAERFEPVSLSDGLGGSSEQLVVLSGPKPTRQERVGRFIFGAFVLIGVAAAAALAVGFVRGMPTKVFTVVGGTVLLVALVIGLVVALHRLAGRWFLVPAGVAIVGGVSRRRGEVTLLTRFDAYVLLRYVHTGKSSVLVLEIVASNTRRYRCSVSEREALGFLAAWQSPQQPPTIGQLQELAGVDSDGARDVGA